MHESASPETAQDRLRSSGFSSCVSIIYNINPRAYDDDGRRWVTALEDPTSSEVTAAASSKTARAVAASDAAAAPTAGAGDDERINGVPLVDAGAEARDGRVCGAGGGVPGDPTVVAQGVIGGGENFGGCELGGNEPDEGAGGATTASDMDVEEGEAGPQAHHRKTAARSLRLAPVDGRPRLNLNGPHCVSIDRLWVERASYAYLTNRRPHDRGSSSTTERRPAKRLHVTRHPPRGLPSPRSNARTPASVDTVTAVV